MSIINHRGEFYRPTLGQRQAAIAHAIGQEMRHDWTKKGMDAGEQKVAALSVFLGWAELLKEKMFADEKKLAERLAKEFVRGFKEGLAANATLAEGAIYENGESRMPSLREEDEPLGVDDVTNEEAADYYEKADAEKKEPS